MARIAIDCIAAVDCNTRLPGSALIYYLVAIGRGSTAHLRAVYVCAAAGPAPIDRFIHFSRVLNGHRIAHCADVVYIIQKAPAAVDVGFHFRCAIHSHLVPRCIATGGFPAVHIAGDRTPCNGGFVVRGVPGRSRISELRCRHHAVYGTVSNDCLVAVGRTVALIGPVYFAHRTAVLNGDGVVIGHPFRIRTPVSRPDQPPESTVCIAVLYRGTVNGERIPIKRSRTQILRTDYDDAVHGTFIQRGTRYRYRVAIHIPRTSKIHAAPDIDIGKIRAANRNTVAAGSSAAGIATENHKAVSVRLIGVRNGNGVVRCAAAGRCTPGNQGSQTIVSRLGNGYRVAGIFCPSSTFCRIATIEGSRYGSASHSNAISRYVTACTVAAVAIDYSAPADIQTVAGGLALVCQAPIGTIQSGIAADRQLVRNSIVRAFSLCTKIRTGARTYGCRVIRNILCQNRMGPYSHSQNTGQNHRR